MSAPYQTLTVTLVKLHLFSDPLGTTGTEWLCGAEGLLLFGVLRVSRWLSLIFARPASLQRGADNLGGHA